VGAAAIRGAFGILPAYGNNGKCTQANDRFKATISLGPAPGIGRLQPDGIRQLNSARGFPVSTRSGR
jgi:hypothetical protein